MIADDALVVSSVVGQVCQRCRQIPRANCLDARGLHDVLRKCIVQQQYGVCPPVRILPVHIRTKREGVGVTCAWEYVSSRNLKVRVSTSSMGPQQSLR